MTYLHNVKIYCKTHLIILFPQSQNLHYARTKYNFKIRREIASNFLDFKPYLNFKNSHCYWTHCKLQALLLSQITLCNLKSRLYLQFCLPNKPQWVTPASLLSMQYIVNLRGKLSSCTIKSKCITPASLISMQ